MTDTLSCHLPPSFILLLSINETLEGETFAFLRGLTVDGARLAEGVRLQGFGRCIVGYFFYPTTSEAPKAG